MSFRLKLILAMTALIGALSLASLLVTGRSVESRFQELASLQEDREIRTLEKRRSDQLKEVFARMKAGLRNPRIAAGFLIEEPTERAARIHADLGPELESILKENEALLGVFDSEGRFLPEPTYPEESQRLGKQLAALLPEVEDPDPQAGFVVLEKKDGEKIICEVFLHPAIDLFDNTRLGTVAVVCPLGLPVGESAEPSELKMSILVSGQMHGDGIPFPETASPEDADGSLVGIDMQAHDLSVRALEQPSRFPAAWQVTAFSRESLSRALRSLRFSVARFAVIAFLVGLAASWLLSGQICRPVSELTKGTKSILEGEFGHRLPVRSQDEIGNLTSAFNEMSEGLEMKERYRSVLGRVSDPEVAETLVEGGLELGGEEREASVLFCDIRGFTTLTEKMAPSDVVSLLNEHMTALTASVHEHGGIVDKFIGDEIMAVFGVPSGSGHHEEEAAACALDMIRRRARLDEESGRSIAIGIGIASGNLLAGCMGSEERLNYTVLGNVVNRAARLCSEAKAGEVLADSATTRQALDEASQPEREQASLKGFSAPISFYMLKDDPDESKSS